MRAQRDPQAFIVDQGTGDVTPVPTGPITVEELRARGVDDELEGRALDVVLRCGWPRPGDVLGIKPCIPIEMGELRKVLEEAGNSKLSAAASSTILLTFLRSKLRHQQYVMGLYVETADEAALPEVYQTKR